VKSLSQQRIILFYLAGLLLLLISILFWDARIALYINDVVQASPSLKNSFQNIPNLLPIIVFWGSATMGIVYFRSQYKGCSHHTDFLKLATITLPVAFLLKMFLQYFFGRTNIRSWLLNGGRIEFAWFTSLSQQPCFPSGHMTVFSAFFVAVVIYYPRLRTIASIALLILAATLMCTNYHFLGDVIAGIISGVLVTTTIRKILHETQRETPSL
jgi:membrane-associated phospholipid phosphatase